ncbi:MAG TPA: hypothetical protein GX692_02790 [Acholeplasmataceae bacterium]|nr:hypothetical protein [Acholeplasmataceae bacterium]
MKKFLSFIVLLFSLALTGCTLAIENSDSDDNGNIIKNPNLLVGLFIDYNNNFSDYESSDYLVLLKETKTENSSSYTIIHSKKGFINNKNELGTHRDGDQEINTYSIETKIYFIDSDIKLKIYGLYEDKDHNIKQELLDQRSYNIQATVPYIKLSYEDKLKINNKETINSIEINLIPIDKLIKFSIEEYDSNKTLIKETFITEDKIQEMTLNKDTEYYIIKEHFQKKDGTTYNYRSLYDVRDIYNSEFFILKFANKYGFVDGNYILIYKSK